MKSMEVRDVVNLLVTVFLPPLGVALKQGFGGHFWLNLVLTVFGFYVAGLVHGVYVVLRD
jgi:uncharacterized membrane protein YqaE (UPF0057 family)